MSQLIVSEPACAPIAIDLREPLVAGRDKQNPLPLVHQPVSRQHAIFEPDDDGWAVRDLGSANGTFVNGLRISRHKLSDGDVVQIGPVKVVYQEATGPDILLTLTKTDEDTLTLHASNPRLDLLYEVLRATKIIEDPEQLITRIPDMVLRLVGCERVMLALSDQAHKNISRQIVHTRAPEPDHEITISRKILQAVLERRESVLIGRREEAPRTLVKQGILSAMSVPLEAGGHTFGLIYADDRGRENRFNAADLDFLTILGRLVGAMFDNAERLQRARALAEATGGVGPLHEIVGQSVVIQKLRQQIAKIAAAPMANVLIRGESGTGKERVARALHRASPRAQHPFVAVNCAAIPDTMIESALFGYEKGAFTGATQARRGQFVLAGGGTLFLDEIGDLSLSAQAKVLRVLQEGELLPLGAEVPVKVDVRVFAATHKDLRREIAEGRFREDLYYRINVLEIDVPPLRSRGSDIDLLARIFLDSAALNLGKRLHGFSPAALVALRSYSWPGNVRELRNEVERALVQAEGSVVEVDDLSSTLQRVGVQEPQTMLPSDSLAMRFAALEPTERALVEEALRTARGNLTEAARLLGMTRIMMRRRVEKFGLRCKDG